MPPKSQPSCSTKNCCMTPDSMPEMGLLPYVLEGVGPKCDIFLERKSLSGALARTRIASVWLQGFGSERSETLGVEGNVGAFIIRIGF